MASSEGGTRNPVPLAVMPQLLVTVATESRQQLYCSTLTEPEANSLADFTKLLSFDMVRTSKECLQSLQVVVSEVNELC